MAFYWKLKTGKIIDKPSNKRIYLLKFCHESPERNRIKLRRYSLKIKQKSHYGLWAFIGTIPLILLVLYPVFLDYAGRSKERYNLLHNHNQLPQYVQLLLIAIILPFAVYILARFIDMLKINRSMKTGMEASAKIVTITNNGSKRKEGLKEYWGVMLELEVNVPGKAPYRASVEYYIYTLDIPVFQPGAEIQVFVSTSGDNKITIPF